jgi:thioredoxin-like negative regulator of GroEL
VKSIIRDFNVESIPTLVSIYGGTVLDVHVGSQEDDKLQAMMAKLSQLSAGSSSATDAQSAPRTIRARRPDTGACRVD